MKPCSKGHTSGRYASGNCIQCAKDRATKWYKENSDRARESRLLYYINNKDNAVKKAVQWNKENKDRRAEICAKYTENNKEKLKDWRNENRDRLISRKAKYNIDNKDSINKKNALYKKNNKQIVNACNASRRARVRGADGNFTRSDIDVLLIQQLGICAICKIKLVDYHIDHILPIALGGSNHPENLQILCPTCNLKKGAKHPNDYIFEIGNAL